MRKALVLISVIIMAGCTETVKNYVAKVKLHQLDVTELYDKEKVYDVIFDAEELAIDSLKNQSRKLFLEGIDLYRNKKQAVKAIELFKSSIFTFPDAKTYYELGNALIDAGLGSLEYLDAIKAFEVAEHLKFQPLSMIQYNTACAYYKLSEHKGVNEKDRANYQSRAIYALKDAFENGFSDTLMLNKDERINSIMQADNYKIMLTEVKPNAFNANTTLFNAFVNSFSLKTESFEITPERVQMKGYDQSINYTFAKFIPEMENVSFGRDVSHDFFYVARVAEKPKYVAVLYSSINFYGEEMQPVSTQLATYSPEGELISSRLFSCSCSADKIKTGKIENGTVTVSDYNRIWKHPIDQVSFRENEVEKVEMVATTTFNIDENGVINEGTSFKPNSTAPYALAELK